MTQYSYPWPGTAPGDGVDGGPYSAADWWGRIVALLSTGGVVDPTVPLLPAAGRYNLGVLHDIGNDLVVANPANNDITIATGAAVVDGAVHFNDALLTLEIPLPSVNPRIDRIVVRKNYTSNQYDPAGDAGVEEVPAYTARITRIVGTEAAAPAAPALVQSTSRTTYWDVPLAQFQISTAGVITALVDQREFAPLWDTENIADGAIDTDQLADDAVTTDKIADDAVTIDQIADDAVGTDQIADSAVNTDRIADDAVTSAKLGPGVPYIAKRQGGAEWGYAGTDNYTPTRAVLMQAGTYGEVVNPAANSGNFTVTFPQAFAECPTLLVTPFNALGEIFSFSALSNPAGTQFTVYWATKSGNTIAEIDCYWLAFAEEAAA